MSQDLLLVLGNGMVVAAALPALVFPIVYTVWFRWWETLLGRALWMKAFGLALLVGLGILRVLFGEDYPGRAVVRLVAFTVVACGLWFQLFSMFRVRQESRRQRRQELARLHLIAHHTRRRDIDTAPDSEETR